MMIPSHIDQSPYKRAWLIVPALSRATRFNRACSVLARAMGAISARCSLVLQQATDNSPSFR
jgi:hypothetical protein